MLKKRIIGVVIVKDGIAVQSIGFKSFLPIGKPQILVEYLNEWGIDEIVLLDISATKNGNEPNYGLISAVSEKCFVPLTIGGGISKTSHIYKLMQFGADKVCLNNSILKKMDFVKEAVKIFGSQCIVAALDIKVMNKKYKVFDYLRKIIIENDLLDFLKELGNIGIGEIFLNNVDLDGSKKGYDLELISYVKKNVHVPVICCGGAGKPEHLLDVVRKTNVNGIAAANFFSFFEHSVAITKSNIIKEFELRNDVIYNYSNSNFFENGRIKKKNEDVLERMLYEKIEEELI